MIRRDLIRPIDPQVEPLTAATHYRCTRAYPGMLRNCERICDPRRRRRRRAARGGCRRGAARGRADGTRVVVFAVRFPGRRCTSSSSNSNAFSYCIPILRSERDHSDIRCPPLPLRPLSPTSAPVDTMLSRGVYSQPCSLLSRVSVRSSVIRLKIHVRGAMRTPTSCVVPCFASSQPLSTAHIEPARLQLVADPARDMHLVRSERNYVNIS